MAINEVETSNDAAKHEDRRVRYTKMAIHEAFFALLREKGFRKMSVSDICRAVDLSRGTFYLHYVDKYALLDEVIDRTLESDAPAEDRFDSIRLNVQANPDWQLLYSSPETSPHVAARIAKLGIEVMVPRIMEITGLDEERARLVFLFGNSGLLAVNNELNWQSGEFNDEMQEILHAFLLGGTEAIRVR